MRADARASPRAATPLRVQIRGALMAMDVRVFPSAEEVAAVRKCVPNDDERQRLLAALQSLAPDAPLAPDEWGCMPAPPPQAAALFTEADLFAYDLLRVPMVRRRLRVHELSLASDGRLGELEAVVGAYADAARAVRASASLRKCMGLLLAAGNFMNHGNARLGGALGVRPLALPKLKDVRASGRSGSAGLPRESLLCFVAKRMDESDSLEEELEPVLSDLLKMDLRELNALVDGLGANLHEMRAEIASAPPAVRVRVSASGVDASTEARVAGATRGAGIRVEASTGASIGEESEALDAAEEAGHSICDVGGGDGGGGGALCVRVSFECDRLAEVLSPQLEIATARYATLRMRLKATSTSVSRAMTYMGEGGSPTTDAGAFFAAMADFVAAFKTAAAESDAAAVAKAMRRERMKRQQKPERIVHDGSQNG